MTFFRLSVVMFWKISFRYISKLCWQYSREKEKKADNTNFSPKNQLVCLISSREWGINSSNSVLAFQLMDGKKKRFPFCPIILACLHWIDCYRLSLLLDFLLQFVLALFNHHHFLQWTCSRSPLISSPCGPFHRFQLTISKRSQKVHLMWQNSSRLWFVLEQLVANH